MLILTRPAIAAIEASMNSNDKVGYGVRITAENAGCSGPKYSMRFEQEPLETDVILEIRDVRVFVDEESMNILTGATVDYSESPENFGFNFALALPDEAAAATCTTPAKSQDCGCGKPS
jgi:iron-sulfur cluster assembly protein